MAQHQVPEVAGIDLDFTPRSYFTERDLKLALPSDIMGKARRDLARRFVVDGEDAARGTAGRGAHGTRSCGHRPNAPRVHGWRVPAAHEKG